MKRTILLITVAIFTIAFNLSAQENGTFTDSRDGKTYKTVKIGSQTWLAENLAFKAENGCRAYKNDMNNISTYGYLYDWETANAACPGGWHLPTREEIKTLINYLGGYDVAGGKLKSTTGWEAPNTGATNESGFTALPGGYRSNIDGRFNNVGHDCSWWSNIEGDTFWGWGVTYDGSYIGEYNDGDYSVRCIKD